MVREGGEAGGGRRLLLGGSDYLGLLYALRGVINQLTKPP